MNELSGRVPESVINALARRTARLIELVDRVTQTATEKRVREGGAQFVELLAERLEELREQHAVEDDEIVDRVKAFQIRLRLAEAKISTWPGAKLTPLAKPARAVKAVRPAKPAVPAKPTVAAKPAPAATKKPAVAAKKPTATVKPRTPHDHTPSKPTKTAA